MARINFPCFCALGGNFCYSGDRCAGTAEQTEANEIYCSPCGITCSPNSATRTTTTNRTTNSSGITTITTTTTTTTHNNTGLAYGGSASASVSNCRCKTRGGCLFSRTCKGVVLKGQVYCQSCEILCGKLSQKSFATLRSQATTKPCRCAADASFKYDCIARWEHGYCNATIPNNPQNTYCDRCKAHGCGRALLWCECAEVGATMENCRNPLRCTGLLDMTKACGLYCEPCGDAKCHLDH